MEEDDSRHVVRQRRRQLGLTQGDLAEAAGISLRTLKSWESGRLPVYMQATSRLAAALGLTLDELAGIEDRPPMPPPADPVVTVDGVPYGPLTSETSSDPASHPAAILGLDADLVERDEDLGSRKQRKPRRPRR